MGVGDDTINVTVKPFVMTRDNFCTVKPVTRTQPTWTDLILTCDSATNTQVCISLYILWQLGYYYGNGCISQSTLSMPAPVCAGLPKKYRS